MAYLLLFKQLWFYAAGHRWKIIAYFFLHGLGAFALLSTPLIFAQILNTLQLAERNDILPSITQWVIYWIGAFLVFNFGHRLGRYFEFDVAYRVKQKFINSFYHKVTNLPLKWHTDHHSGDTINRINLAGDSLHNFSVMQFLYIEYFITFWGALIALAYLSWQVALISFVIAIFTIFIISRFDQYIVKLYRQMNAIAHKISAAFFDYVSNIRTIITLRLGRRTQHELNERIEAGYIPYMKAESWINACKWFSVSCCMVIQEISIVFYYIWQQLSKDQTILIGNVSAVFQYAQKLNMTFINIAREYQQIIHWHTNFEAISDIENEASAIHMNENISNWRSLKINNLSFEYEAGKKTLSDISFAITRGEKIALVGESGSGKSSLMALMRGLYEPSHIEVSLDHKKYNTLNILSGTTTLIPQDPEVFENTIEYNITVGIEYSEDDVQRAACLACFDKVINRLPHGLATDVREKGVSLSGGERQRLALARGILAAKNSSIILMDEPTSSVDAHNELNIYENLLEHFKDQTIISSIHRLHLLGKFDRIIVLEHGRIIQNGTFEELKNETGLFQDLWNKYSESSHDI